MKRLLIYTCVIVLLIAGGYFLVKNNLASDKNDSKEIPKEVEVEKPTSLIDKSLVEEKTIQESTEYATFDVSYPEFKNVSSSFNKKIEDLVMEEIDNHKEISEENWKARYETKLPGDKISEFPTKAEKYQLSISWKGVQVNENFVSIIIVFNGYTGGAHGYENIISFNYDVLNKKEITLSSLFSSDPNYLKTISEFSRNDLEKQFRKRLNVKTKEDEANFKDSVVPMILEGTMPEEANFSIFTFVPDAVTFYFAQYQVAPYAMGGSSVTMPI